jgi:hypothetical protein
VPADFNELQWPGPRTKQTGWLLAVGRLKINFCKIFGVNKNTSSGRRRRRHSRWIGQPASQLAN